MPVSYGSHRDETVKEKTLVESSKNEFYLRLNAWYLKHEAFLKERSKKVNAKGYFP